MAETAPKGPKLKDFMKQYGKLGGGVLESSRRDASVKHPRLPTGFFNLDAILDGGVRAGSYIEIYGQESVGKSYLAQNIAAQCQALWNRPVAYMDFEGTWDGGRASEIGMDIGEDALALFNFPSMEDNYNFLRVGLGERAFGAVIVDSISGMPVKYETENEVEKQTMAYQARVHSKALRVITPFLGDTIVILINQVRDSMSMYGPAIGTAGGRAIKHYDHLRLEMRRENFREERPAWDHHKLTHTNQKVNAGHFMNFRLAKNKLGRPEQTSTLFFDYDRGGVDRTEDVLSYLRQADVVTREGDYFFFPDGKKTHGRKRAYKHVEGNYDAMEALAKEAMFGAPDSGQE